MQQLAKQLIDEDRRPIPEDEQVWHVLDDAMGDVSILCTGEFVDYGCGEGEYLFKTVKRGGITCKKCLERIMYYKSIKL